MNKILKQVTVVLLCVGFSGVWASQQAQAQDDEGPEGEFTELKDREKFDQKLTQMPAAEKESNSLDRIGKMKESKRRVEAMLVAATDNAETELANCVNRKLAPINGLVNSSETAYTELKTANQSQDVSASNHYYKMVLTNQSKVLDLERQAKLCKRTDQLADGSGNAQVTEDPSIPNVVPVPNGGYADIGDVYGDVLEPDQLFPTTPFQ